MLGVRKCTTRMPRLHWSQRHPSARTNDSHAADNALFLIAGDGVWRLSARVLAHLSVSSARLEQASNDMKPWRGTALLARFLSTAYRGKSCSPRHDQHTPLRLCNFRSNPYCM